MRRYLLFAGDTYYPGGGWEDFIESANSVQDALIILSYRDYEWYHIVDQTTGLIVVEYPERA